MDKPIIVLKILDRNGNKIRKVVTRNRRRFCSILKAKRFSNCNFFLRVRYANGNTNEGDYFNKKELILAFKAFTESE